VRPQQTSPSSPELTYRDGRKLGQELSGRQVCCERPLLTPACLSIPVRNRAMLDDTARTASIMPDEQGWFPAGLRVQPGCGPEVAMPAQQIRGGG
jgi:hypothetical protein